MTKIFLMLATVLTLTGCATTPRPTPLTQADIISMTKAGATDEDIMRRIDGTRTVFQLSSDSVVLLRKEGVSDRVVTYMLDTLTRAAVAEERRRSYYDYNFYYGTGFFYGQPRHRHW